MSTFTHNSVMGQSALAVTTFGPILLHLTIDLDARPGRNGTRVFAGFRDGRLGGASGERASTKDGDEIAWSALAQGF